MTRRVSTRLRDSARGTTCAVFDFDQDTGKFRGRGRPAKSEDLAGGGGRRCGGFVALRQEDETGDVAVAAFMELDPRRVGSGHRGKQGIEPEAPAEMKGFIVRGDRNDAVIAGSEQINQMAGFGGFGGEEEKSE